MIIFIDGVPKKKHMFPNAIKILESLGIFVEEW
jgi:hypothetical protein